MAVQLVSISKRFIGLTSDVKPVDNIPAGSTFLETDVFLDDGLQRIAKWDGKDWVYPQLVERESFADALEPILREIAALRLGMIYAETCQPVDLDDVESLVA